MFAHTKEDVEAWLEVLRSVVPKGVPVTTSEEIALSWEGKGRWTAAPTTEDDDILYRVTAFPNGKTAGGKMLELPASFEKLRILASDALGFAVALVFSADGEPITDISLVKDDDVIVVTNGEAFSCPPDAVWNPRLLGAGASDKLALDSIESDDDDDETPDDEGAESLEDMLRSLELEAGGLKERLEDGTGLGVIPEGTDEEEDGDDDDDDDYNGDGKGGEQQRGASHSHAAGRGHRHHRSKKKPAAGGAFDSRRLLAVQEESDEAEDYDNLDLALEDPEGPYISLEDIQAMRRLQEEPEDSARRRSSEALGPLLKDTGYIDVAAVSAQQAGAGHTQQDGASGGYMEVGDVRQTGTGHTQQDGASGGYMEVGDVRQTGTGHTQQDGTSGGYMEVGDRQSSA